VLTTFDKVAKKVFAPVARLARQLLAAPITFVTVVDSGGTPSTFLLTVDDDEEKDWESLTFAIAKLCLASDGVLNVPNGREDHRLAPLIDSTHTFACLAERLVDITGDVCGVFGVIDRQQREWTMQDQATLADLSGFAVAEIDRRDAVRLRFSEDHSTEQLLNLAKALTAASGLEEIMQRTSRIAGDLVGASFAYAAIADLESGDLSLRFGKTLRGSESEQATRLQLNHSSSLGRAVLTGHPVHLGTADEITREYPLEPVDVDVHALAAYPTRRGQAAIGFAWSHAVIFTEPMRRTLATVAELFGLGLERALVSDRERAVARRLQRSLLPGVLPLVPGAQTAAMYEAGADNLDVGGDWYDIVTAGQDRFVLGIGDVVGRGLNAAVTMGELRHAFAALVSSSDSLAAIIKNLDHFAQNVEGARLSTMVAASYEASTGNLELISAGHMPPMVRRSDGEVMQFPNGGPPLGLGEQPARSTVKTTLGEGESLWLYTDGLVERRGEPIDVGLARLRSAISNAGATDSSAALRNVYAELGRPVHDDVAVVVLSR